MPVASRHVLRLHSGTVRDVTGAWRGAVELRVQLDPVEARSPLITDEVPALALTGLVGIPADGDRVLVSTDALERGLGTGGHALVVHVERAAEGPPDGTVDARTGPDTAAGQDRVMKARYTPTQVAVAAVEDHGSPHRRALEAAARAGLGGLPVVTADLHSSLPAVLAGVLARLPRARVAYLVQDTAALPLAVSRTVPALAGLLTGTVTCGQAYGGDLEAVTVHSGLLACRAVLGADVVVVAPGPGSVGTGTAWGFGGVAAGEAVNAVAVLGGRPVASLRVSGSDDRPRHRGLSHHSLTAYGRVALAGADVVVPTGLPGGLDAEVLAACTPLQQRHRLVQVPVEDVRQAVDAVDDRLRRAGTGGLRTMGRDLVRDPAPFLAAAAAGWHAAGLVRGLGAG